MDDIETAISDLSEGVEIIRKSLQCAICLELLKNPVRTRCSHSFCWQCIMTVIKTNRTARCPLCNKSVNRRSITEDEKVGTLVEKARNLIGNIEKDTGFDITSHNKLPSSTCEAVIASPQFHQKKEERVSVQHEASSHMAPKPAETSSKEQWLKRYKGSYPGKRDSTWDNIDLLSISQAEPVDQSFIARDIALYTVDSKVDKLKVPPTEKVQEWLQRNIGEVDNAQVSSSESNVVTVTADVHRGLNEEQELLSVSQQRFYIAPRKADVGALWNSSERLQSTYDIVKQASNEKSIRVFTSKVGNENDTNICERVRNGKNIEDDPYEFISSQKTGTLSKKKVKRKMKGETVVQKTGVKHFKKCDPPSTMGNNKNPIEQNTLFCDSPPASDFTFVCPVDVNDTFDNLVANTRKPESMKTVKTGAIEVVAGDDNDMCLFRTPLEVPATSQNNGDSTTESMSDVDFSSGSSEEWGESNQVKQEPIQVNSRRTRSSSHNLPVKKSPTRSTSRLTAEKRSSGICSRRNEKLEVKEVSEQKRQVKNSVKPKPFSPVEKVNLNANVEDFNTANMKQHPAVCNNTNKKSEDKFVTCLSTDKAHTGKENVICPVTVKYGVEKKKNLEHKAMNTTVNSRSPGWSRISQSKQDFERFKKPALKALNVSGGEVCTSKKHTTSVSEVPMKSDINEVMSPPPSIDDSDSSFGIPVVAFHSPESSNRCKMMSRIVMDLESQIGPNSSTENIAYITTEMLMPHTTEDVALQKCVSFGSDAFNEPVNKPDCPNSCQKKELTCVVLSSLEDKDQLRHRNKSNKEIMSGITKLSEGETASQDEKRDDDNKKNPVTDTIETVFIVQESNSIVAHEQATENSEHNQDDHNKDNGNIMNDPVVNSSETLFMVQESNSTTHEQATENNEHNQDNHNKDNGNIMKNLVLDTSRNKVLMVQGSYSTKKHEEENTEYNQESNYKDNGNITKNHVFDIGDNILMVQESHSITTYDEATENIQWNTVVGQNITSTETDCIKMKRSLKPARECKGTVSPEYLNGRTEKSAEAMQNSNINTQQFPENSSLAASNQDLQALILSEKCNQEKLAVSSSDTLINSKAQQSRLCSTQKLQLQTLSIKPTEITENFHQTDMQSNCNSSVCLANSYHNTMHITFIKCGRLTSSRNFTKFVLLGSLAPKGKNSSSEIQQELNSADSLGVQSGSSGGEPLRMNCETGTQTSPGLLDAKIKPTPPVNPKSVQFTTSTGTTNHTQEHSEDFVPDSCNSTCAFPCAVPLPHHSFVRQNLVDSNKCNETGDSLIIRATSELLNADKCLEDDSVKDNMNIDRPAVLHNKCEYSKTVDHKDHEISTSHFSAAKTVNIQQISASDNGRQSPELHSNLITDMGLNVPILQETSSGKTVSSNQDKCDARASQKAILDIQNAKPDQEERNAKSHQQNEIIIPMTDGFPGHLIEDSHSKSSELGQNKYDNTSAEKSSKRSSKTNRQFTFSPNFIPKLSDPNLDVNTEDGETGVKKSYKRIRVEPVSSDSVSVDCDSNDMSHSETREIKKPRHTSLRKVSNDMDTEVLASKEGAATSPEVINFLTSSEESNNGHLTPEVDDRTINEGKWLEEDVPDSEELMARVMANVEADLVETRKRKTREGNDRQEMSRESPMLFTPPPFVADSEELGSRMTCELVVIGSEVECENRPVQMSFLGNTTLSNESKSLNTQQRNKIQADIQNLETEIKECDAELQNLMKSTFTGKTHLATEGGDSENESADFVEPTPKEKSTSNKTWGAEDKDDDRPQVRETHFQQPDHENLTTPFSIVHNTMKRMLPHNPESNSIVPGRSPSALNSKEMQCKQIGTHKHHSAEVKSHAVSPKSKHNVLQLPHKNISSTLPIIRAEKVGSGKIHTSSVPANSSNTREILTPASVSKPALPQPSPQISTVERPCPTKLCFVCSGLHSGLIARVKALAKLLGAEFSNKFEPHTTHLVVRASDTMMADKTLKYLSAVVKKTWIVSIAWVNACLQERKLVPEDEYELLDSSGENGPHRSRISTDLLYRNFEFCCIEPLTDLSREQLQGILKDCGATIVNHPEKFSFQAGHCSMIIIQMNEEREEECKELWERYGVLPVGHEWVFECIGRYRIIPIWSFLTCAVNEDRIRTLGYPEDALASDDDDETVVESQA